MDVSFSGRWPFQFPVPNSRVTLQPRRFAFGILIPTSEFLLWRACQCVQCFPFLLVVNAFVGMPEPRLKEHHHHNGLTSNGRTGALTDGLRTGD